MVTQHYGHAPPQQVSLTGKSKVQTYPSTINSNQMVQVVPKWALAA